MRSPALIHCVGMLLPMVLLPAVLQAQQQPRQTCDGPEYRHFDFWIGEWNVTAEDGRTLGTNIITRVLDGCALLESWTGAAGGTGHSLNAWDRTTGKWRQTWIDNSGGRLELTGTLQGGGNMLLANQDTTAEGAVVRQRLSFEPTAYGVRQKWERSRDDGKTWEVLFDGQYRRRAGSSDR
jgi:hypothetical protein